MLSNPFATNAAQMLARINSLRETVRAEPDSVLQERSRVLGHRARAGERIQSYLVEAFAIGREAAKRTLGFEHYDVQVLGSVELASERIIEMETGQGKTLAATLPLYLYALQGNGSHLATSNDYLANRDADTMRPLFQFLGLTTGVITAGMCDDLRRAQYAHDITYGTTPEFGFDFLRDRIKRRENRSFDDRIHRQTSEQLPVQRDLHFILADEADALLIDEANTPLIIGTAGELDPSAQALFCWCAEAAPVANENEHFQYRLRDKRVELTRLGRTWARHRVQQTKLQCRSVLELYEYLERAIYVHRDIHRDTQYIVRDKNIVLVDEATGRLGEGKEMADGIQQAIQAAEQLEITPSTTHAAKLTMQGLFLCYQHRAGMTGTALASQSEFRKVYKMRVVSIPPRIASRRVRLATRFFQTESEKWAAICEEIYGLHHEGRPVLVGTRSVEKSDRLSQLLHIAGIPHAVLNAREHAAEAKIIAKAGHCGQVTVATSMAGRGTDIRLPETAVRLGGLHVIVSEHHESLRQDQQLFGRCGRQGEPGTFRQYLSLDDDILSLGFGDQQAVLIRDQSAGEQAKLLAQAQNKLESRRRQSRIAALHHEKRQLRSIWEMGRDPLLDVM